MKLIDMHCDTMWKLQKLEEGYGGQEPRRESLYQNTGHINIEGMKKAGTVAQFFANYIDMAFYHHDWEKGYEGALELIRRSKRELGAASDDVQILSSYDTLPSKIGAFLTVEEGGILNGKMERLNFLYEQGIRLITLTWNYENCIGYPNSEDPSVMNRGLKPFGFETVEEMNRLGMIVDVSHLSHLSDGGFWDVVSHSKRPVAASHSNARALCDVRRNLTDPMLKALGEQGGICGVNFFPCFVKKDAACSAADLAAHVKHMIDMGGEELPAVGTDFDGYDVGKSDINHVSEMDKFYAALKDKGLTQGQVEKVCYKNAERSGTHFFCVSDR